VSPQDWKEVEERLKSFYLTTELRCDGWKITLILQSISQFKNAIVVYVNGVVKGEWIVKDCEERRRFLCPVKRSLYSQKQKAALRKIPKKIRREHGLYDPDAQYVRYSYYWTSFKALKSHLIKHNRDIEWMQ